MANILKVIFFCILLKMLNQLQVNWIYINSNYRSVKFKEELKGCIIFIFFRVDILLPTSGWVILLAHAISGALYPCIYLLLSDKHGT